MKILCCISIFLILINKCQFEYSSKKIYCLSNEICSYPNGDCILNECICSEEWITSEETKGCTYQLKSKLVAFLLSFFLGVLGIDWFYLSMGNVIYIILGLIKLFTLGGLGIWWIVDWIRILANAFDDGNGVYLRDWNN